MAETAVTGAERREEEGRGRRERVRLALEVEPDYTDLASDVLEDLGEALAERFPEVKWDLTRAERDAHDLSISSRELVKKMRERALEESWELVVCLTKLPLRRRGRPVVASARPTEGVGIISVPALGVVGVEARVRETILEVIEQLLGEDGARRSHGRRGRIRARLVELGTSLSTRKARGDGTIRFTTAVIRGNLRLLLGMLRANHPWRVVVRLSRVMVAAVGTAAYMMASSTIWQLATSMEWPRLVGLTVLTVTATSTTLIVAHHLWERSSRPEERERVVLFNTITTLTIAIGVLTCYLALFAFVIGAALIVIPGDLFAQQTHHPGDIVSFAHLAWFAASLATLAGALGSLTESDLAVREAAYGYQPTSERGSTDAD